VLTVLKNVNLALTFVLELAVLIALCYWGFQTGQGTIFKIVLGVGPPILAIVAWGMFGAPRSQWRLRGIGYLMLQVMFFGAAALALFFAGQRGLALIFVVICVVCLGLNYFWQQ
jgi:hypothetical protein